jgi:hypothetical protein
MREAVVTVIIIHAGMGKAGSSSIQHWLQRNSGELRERGFTVLTASETEGGGIEFVPHEGGGVNLGWIAAGATKISDAGRQKRVENFVAGLDRAARRHGDTIVSSEAFATPFWSLHAVSLGGFQWLATRHEVRVAYYARPQHTCLEAHWRQTGYRLGQSPSAHVESRAPRLAYASTRAGVRSLAPGIEFEPRPFRTDLLHRGDVVSDFAHAFLGIDLPRTGEWTNRGLPLEVVNLLHTAPPGRFWARSYGNARIKRIKRLLDGTTLPEDEHIALSRRILRKYAYERYGAENAELGWSDFVTPPEDADELPGLEALDSLWAPRATRAERAILFRALSAAIERS